MSATKPFWLVWNPDGNSPRFQHPTEQSARTEAERLARANPGNQFVVLESVAAYTRTDVATVNLRPDPIPF